MGRNELKHDTQKVEFTSKYIPKGYTWRVMAEGENHFKEEYKLGPIEYHVHTLFFREVGLKLPLWPLLVDFLIFTHLMLGQLNPNVIRIIGDIVALNKSHDIYLSLNDLRYYYSFTRGNYGYSLSTRNDAPSLVLALRDSHKGVDADVVGFLELDSTNKPIPCRASSPGLYIFTVLNFYMPVT